MSLERPALPEEVGRRSADSDPDLLMMGYGVVGWLRWLLVGHAVFTNVLRAREVNWPVTLLVATAAMVGWTWTFNRLNQRVSHRTFRVGCTDLAFTVGLTLISPWVVGEGPNYLSIPVYWGLVAPMAFAVWGGFGTGVVAGAIVGLALAVSNPTWGAPMVALVLVNPVAAGAVGMLMDGVRQVVAQREAEQARLAAIAERERLSRIVHDGTLQVLALVEREGRTLGPRGDRLARLASAQEAQLRTLLQDRRVNTDTDQVVDVATMLERHASEVLTVSVMAGEVPVPAEIARELDQAVAELVSNVVKHAGPGAHAWLLLEQVGDGLVVWFRDDGVGMTPEQVEGLPHAGRMGITGSVTGRMEALGGSAHLTSRPGKGVEWELRVPVPAS